MVSTSKSIIHGKNRAWFLLISCVVIILDQWSKALVRKNLALYQTKVVIEHFWNWTLAYNRGAAFSLLDKQAIWSKYMFTLVAFIVAIGLIWYLLVKTYNVLIGLALSLILGGAVGNLTDRLIFGKVTDFIQWYYHDYYWPSFNVADSAVCVGIALLIIENLFFTKKD